MVTMTEPMPAAEVDNTPEVVRHAMAQREREARSDAEANLAILTEDQEAYLKLLLRADAPQDGDAESLASVSAALDLTREQVGSDAETVRKALAATARHDSLAECAAAATKAREAFRAMVKEHERLEKEARRAAGSTAARRERAALAKDELQKLARHRPEFFTDENPPRLRGA